MRLLLALCLVGLVAVGCAGPAKDAGVPQDETKAGRKLYVAKCAKCHKFYEPANYSDEEWQVWMKKMSKKSKLKPEQEAMLSRYIEETFRPAGKTNNPASRP